MLALTIWPEWVWAIRRLGKPSENRDWKMPEAVVGQWIALHAGKHVGGRPGDVARVEGLAAVLRTAELCGVWPPGSRQRLMDVSWPENLGAITDVVRLSGYDQLQKSLWDVAGCYHWRWDRRISLPEPVPCRGLQRLWKVPPDVEAEILRQVGGQLDAA